MRLSLFIPGVFAAIVCIASPALCFPRRFCSSQATSQIKQSSK
jgi:hypothetical protein